MSMQEAERLDDRTEKRVVIESLVWRVVVETIALPPGPRRRRNRVEPRVLLYGEEGML
jgi:hypothetical protein